MMIHLNRLSDSGGKSRSNFCIRTEHWTAQHAFWAQHQQNLYCYSCKRKKKKENYIRGRENRFDFGRANTKSIFEKTGNDI